MFHVLAQAVSHSGERIVQMVFIRFQYHLQRHFVVLVVARLVVDITIMQVPIATRRFVFIPMDLQDLSVGLLQVPNKQWGASGYAVTFPIAFNVVYNVLSIPQTTASTSNAYWGRFYITALTKNGFNVSDTGAGSNRWIAIGSAQPQWGNGSSSSFSKKDYATPKDIGTVTISTPISMSTLYQGFICASSTSGPSLFVGFVTAYSGNSLTVRLITSLDSGSGGSLVPNYILLGH